MNYLQLSQRAAVECGINSRSAVTTALSTVVGATGSLGRIVNWVSDSFSDVQTQHDDWLWMRSSNILGAGVSFATVAGQLSYPLGTGAGTVGVTADNFGKWDPETFRTYTTATGTQDETYLDDIPFDNWRNVYMLGANRTVQTRPVAIARGPDQSLNLGPAANGLYTITGDYFVAPKVMALDADVPTGLPTPFHMLIVYGAMMKCAADQSAPELYQDGSSQWNRMMKRLEKLRLPTVGWAGALA